MHIGFVILDYNTISKSEILISSIRRIFREYFVTICVVDNFASRACINGNIAGEDIYIAAGDNLGYAKGNNLGIAHLKSQADLIFVLNPDVSFLNVDLACLAADLDEMKKQGHDIGALSVQGVPDYIHRPGLTSLLFPYFRRIADSRRSHNVDRFQKLYRFHGCAFVINTDCLKDEKDFFCEQTFLYYEEDFLCFSNKFGVVHLSSLTVAHEGSTSVSREWGLKKYWFMYNSLKSLILFHVPLARSFRGITSCLAFISISIRFARDRYK